MIRKPRLLITGSNGLIGTHIAGFALHRFQVITTSKSSSTTEIGQFHRFNWSNIDQIGIFLEHINPDIIIHTAGITSIDYAAKHPDETGEINVKAVNEIVRYCQLKKKRLLHFSTDFVFSGTELCYEEADTIGPQSIYAKSKAESERIVLNELSDAAVIRPSLVYGFSKKLARLNFPLFIKKALEEGGTLDITSDQFRTPTYVDDLAEATLILASSNHQGIFHIAGPECINVYEFAIKVAEVFDLNSNQLIPVRTATTHEACARPLRTCLNIDRSIKLLSYAPLNLSRGLMALKENIDYLNNI